MLIAVQVKQSNRDTRRQVLMMQCGTGPVCAQVLLTHFVFDSMLLILTRHRLMLRENV